MSHNAESRLSEAHGHSVAAPHHHVNYFGIFGLLVVLTIVTVGVAFINIHSEAVKVLLALTIASIKAAFVALFFMHLLHDKPMNGIILLGSFVFLGIFLISCYTDAVTRDRIEPSNLKVQPAAVAPSKVPATPPPGEHH